MQRHDASRWAVPTPYPVHRQETREQTMNDYLRTDQYTHVNRDCPMNIDMHPADGLVEIILGEHRLGGDTLRLVIDHPDTCHRLINALHDAGARLTGHLRAKGRSDSAMSQLDSTVTTSVAG